MTGGLQNFALGHRPSHMVSLQETQPLPCLSHAKIDTDMLLRESPVAETNKDNEPHLGVGSDVPQIDPALDSFGYAAFASQLAASIVKTRSPQGLVMAIHGEWGSGKSSLLNFIKHYIAQVANDARPVVIDFNPWWFESREQLAAQFLVQFQSRLKLENKFLRDVGDLLADYSQVIGSAIVRSTGLPWLDKVASLLKLLKRKPTDVVKLKAAISRALHEANQRFLVVVDDIDRLTPEEMREVFKVIKALADFPNVIYLLSFDRPIVVQALSNLLQFDGEAYLEKIVQAPFTLPSIDRETLQRKLFSNLDQLLEETDAPLFDQAYWSNAFHEGMAPLITNPRDIVRYVNALAVTYPPLRGEVNVADFFALEFLRVNVPSLYETIRDNRAMFAGYADRGIQATERREEREFHNAWAAKLPDTTREGLQSMLERLFPKLSDVGRSGDCLADWRRLRRAAHPDVFATYFQFALDEDQLSRRSVLAFLEKLADQQALEEELLDAIEDKRSDGSSKAKDYLAHVLDFDTEIDHDRAKGLLRSIANIGDRMIIPSDEKGGFFSIRSMWRLTWVFQHALERIDAGQREAELVAAFRDGQAITFQCAAIHAIADCKEKAVRHGPAAVLTAVSQETVTELKAIVVARISEFAIDGSLLRVPELVSVLLRWKSWASAESPRQWVAALLADLQDTIRFIAAFLQESRLQTMGDPAVRITHSLNFELMSEFASLDAVAETLAVATEADFEDQDYILAFDVFNRQYPAFRDDTSDE
jgi:predicted KAP-like P-loop ATPase